MPSVGILGFQVVEKLPVQPAIERSRKADATTLVREELVVAPHEDQQCLRFDFFVGCVEVLGEFVGYTEHQILSVVERGENGLLVQREVVTRVGVDR